MEARMLEHHLDQTYKRGFFGEARMSKDKDRKTYTVTAGCEILFLMTKETFVMEEGDKISINMTKSGRGTGVVFEKLSLPKDSLLRVRMRDFKSIREVSPRMF